MKYIFFLSGDSLELAKEEVFSLFDVKDYNAVNGLLIVESEKLLKKSFKRLALTKKVYQLLFECKINELIKVMKEYDWNSVYKKNFCLRVNDKQHSERKLSGYVWDSLIKPKVNLKNPKTKFELFFVKDKVYCGLLTYENKEDFESRKAHLRPFPHPSSLHPKLARALVNITGVKEDGKLLDPFCGTGGFMIEAGLMKIKTVGYDINKNMIKGCKENLDYFKIKDYKIVNKNALSVKNKLDYVITDLPYGLNSIVYDKKLQKSGKINMKINKKASIKNLEAFYLKFLKNLRKILKNKAVIIFPHYVNYKRLLKTSKLKIEKEFFVYVHNSLSRAIVKVV